MEGVRLARTILMLVPNRNHNMDSHNDVVDTDVVDTDVVVRVPLSRNDIMVAWLM